MRTPPSGGTHMYKHTASSAAARQQSIFYQLLSTGRKKRNKLSIFIENTEISIIFVSSKQEIIINKMNIAAYISYLFLTFLITVKVGNVFYKNGRYYILSILNGDETITDAINKILLIGYYLLNLGYATIMISLWKTITNFSSLIASVATMTGRIVLSLAIIHFVNMYVIYLIGKKTNLFNHHKTTAMK